MESFQRSFASRGSRCIDAGTIPRRVLSPLQGFLRSADPSRPSGSTGRVVSFSFEGSGGAHPCASPRRELFTVLSREKNPNLFAEFNPSQSFRGTGRGDWPGQIPRSLL